MESQYQQRMVEFRWNRGRHFVWTAKEKWLPAYEEEASEFSNLPGAKPWSPNGRPR